MSQIIPANLKLNLTMRDRAGVLFEGRVDAVSSFNDKGPFDVLPLHTNFISLIKKSVTVHQSEKIAQEVQIGGGGLMVKEDKGEVYLGILH